MTEDDEERIERALRRQAMGLPLSTQDRWCLKAHKRREERTMQSESKLDTNTSSNEAWNDWFYANLQTYLDNSYTPATADAVCELIGPAKRELREGFREQIRKLEIEVAELRGQVRAIRTTTGTDAITAAKFVGDAIQKPLIDYIDERLGGGAKGDVIDLPSWRQNRGAA